MHSKTKDEIIVVFLSVALLAVPIVAWLWIGPTYRVWSQRKAGEAMLARSESERRVQIEDAKARAESAKMLASAEVERAKGVAEANKIIGESLTGNEAYLRYLWVQSLTGRNSPTVIYVPTEANLPIMEAGKR